MEDGGVKLIANLFGARVRGFRIVDLAAFGCLAVLVLGVYWFKARAGGESAKIAQVDNQIATEERQIRLLQADLARLEQPDRLERLSTQYLNLGPVQAKHETTVEALPSLAHPAAAAGKAAGGEAPAGAAR